MGVKINTVNIEQTILERKRKKERRIEAEAGAKTWYYWLRYDPPGQVFRCPECHTLYEIESGGEFYKKLYNTAVYRYYKDLGDTSDLACPKCDCKMGTCVKLKRRPTPLFEKEFFSNDPDKLVLETKVINGGVIRDINKVYTYGERFRFVLNKKTKRAYYLTAKEGQPLRIRTYIGRFENSNDYDVNLLQAFSEEYPEWPLKEFVSTRTCVTTEDYLNILTACYRYPQITLLACYPVFTKICREIVKSGAKITKTDPHGIFNEAFGVALGKKGFQYLMELSSKEDIDFKLFRQIFEWYGKDSIKLSVFCAPYYSQNTEIVAEYMINNSPNPTVAINRFIKTMIDYDRLLVFKDIIRMVDVYGLDLPSFANYNMKELNYLHDHLIEATATMTPGVSKKREEQYKTTVYPKLKKYNYKGEMYHIVVPETLKEIINEGMAMGHCVGGYVNDVAKGLTSILLLRTAENERVATIELRDKNIFQVKAKGNFYPGDEAINFVKEFCEAKKLTYKYW